MMRVIQREEDQSSGAVSLDHEEDNSNLRFHQNSLLLLPSSIFNLR